MLTVIQLLPGAVADHSPGVWSPWELLVQEATRLTGLSLIPHSLGKEKREKSHLVPSIRTWASVFPFSLEASSYTTRTSAVRGLVRLPHRCFCSRRSVLFSQPGDSDGWFSVLSVVWVCFSLFQVGKVKWSTYWTCIAYFCWFCFSI